MKPIIQTVLLLLVLFLPHCTTLPRVQLEKSPSVVIGASRVRHIPNPDPITDYRFGMALSAVGESAFAIGAPLAYPGRVYVYDTLGSIICTITNPEPPFTRDIFFRGDNFGRSVSGVGDKMILIGANLDDPRGVTDAGSVYLYNINGKLLCSIPNPAPQTYDEFGFAVCGLGASMLVIGACEDDAYDIGASGSVYLYRNNGELLKVINSPTPQFKEYFGHSLTMVSDSVFAVGAFGTEIQGKSNAGCVYIYKKSGRLLCTIPNPNPDRDDYFGVSVCMVGSKRIIIGAHRKDVEDVDNAGCVYIFTIDGQLVRYIPNPYPEEDDLFGMGIAGIGPDVFVVSANQKRRKGMKGVGTVYLYNQDGKFLAEVRNPSVPGRGDFFGFSLCGLPEDKFAVSAHFDDTHNHSNVGSVFLFKLIREKSYPLPSSSSVGIKNNQLPPYIYIRKMMVSFPGGWCTDGSSFPPRYAPVSFERVCQDSNSFSLKISIETHSGSHSDEIIHPLVFHIIHTQNNTLHINNIMNDIPKGIGSSNFYEQIDYAIDYLKGLEIPKEQWTNIFSNYGYQRGYWELWWGDVPL